MKTRLEMPLRFRAEGHALGIIKAHNLFGIGAQTEKFESGGTAWRIVIYVADKNVEAVIEHLSKRMRGIVWNREET